MKKLFVLSALIMIFAVNTFGQDHKTVAAIKGTWVYNSEMAPYEYQTGKVIFFEEDGNLKAKIDIDGYIIPIETLEIEDAKIHCKATIEYETVNIKLVLKDGKLSGDAVTYEGSIPVKLEKEKE